MLPAAVKDRSPGTSTMASGSTRMMSKELSASCVAQCAGSEISERQSRMGMAMVFPATRHYVDRVTGRQYRHHIHESVLQKAVREAVRNAGIAKPATCHSLRHRSRPISSKTGTIYGPYRSS